MPKYLFKASYAPEGVAGVVAKGGTARRDAIKAVFEAMGGAMEAFYFAFGDTDVYTLGDLPGNEAAAAVALAVNSTGKTSVSTVVLLTADEVDAAAHLSVPYRPPGA